MAITNEDISSNGAYASYYSDTIDLDAWFEVAQADYVELVRKGEWDEYFSNEAKPFIHLLDIGCGTGKFPYLLSQKRSFSSVVTYDYLDPSRWSLNRLCSRLRPPFIPGEAGCGGVQNVLSLFREKIYDVVWAIHSLYALSESEVETTLKRLPFILKDDGTTFIFHAGEHSFYHIVYNWYRTNYDSSLEPFLSAEQIVQSAGTNSFSVSVQRMEFYHQISTGNESLLNAYLSQCTLRSQLTRDWTQNRVYQGFLEQFRYDNLFAFPQEVWLITLKPR